MPENKKPVKQVSVYNGTDWDTHDIGADAENITLSSIGVGNNVQTAFDSLIGSNSLGSRQAVITDSQGRITTGNISVSSLEDLDDMVITDDAGAPTEDVDFTSGDTTLTPASTANVSLLTSSDSWSSRLNKISLMFRNIRYLINKIGTTNLAGVGDGTITGAINAISHPIIYRNTIESRISVADMNRYTNGASITVPSGVYIVTGNWNFNTGASTGARNLCVRISASTGTMTGGNFALIYATNSSYASLNCASILSTTELTVLTLQASSSMTYNEASSNSIVAAKIGNVS